MRKILSLALVLVMMMSFSVTAFAAETTTGDDVTIYVEAKYSDGVGAPDVVSVDVEWGIMQFTYNVGGTKIWDPVNHVYTEGETTATWTAVGNTVKVTNHSNIPVLVNLDFISYGGDITGSFGENAEKGLYSAVGSDVDKADAVTGELTLSGSLSEDHPEFARVGEITVKISKFPAY